MAGMDPMRFLETDDPVEAIVMSVIAKQWFDRRRQLDEALASDIIQALAKAMK